MGSFDEVGITPLSKKVIRGSAWLFSGRIVQRILNLIRTIVLARLLSPNDFGLFGIALLMLSMLDTFSQTGFHQALIQKKEDTKPYLDTAWTVGIIRGFLIAVILFSVAPYVAVFFKAPQVTPILKVIGLAVVSYSTTNIAVVYFEKELEFNKYFAYHVIGAIVDLTVAISAAFLLRSVWALVLGRLAGSLTQCIISYIIDPYRPRFRFEFSKAKKLFGFGKWVLGSSILIFLLTHGDDIFVGKLIGTAALGLYQMAYLISNLPATEITHVISQVTFPAYSKLQDQIPRLRDAYLNVMQITAFLSFPLAGLIFMLAPDFTKIFLGEKWMPMVPALRVLCVFGATRSIGATIGPILYGIGKPKIQTKLSTIQLALMITIIYPLSIRWGILGASFAVLVPNLLALCLIFKEVKHIINSTYKDFFMKIIAPVTTSLAVIFAAFFGKNLLPTPTNIYSFIVITVLCCGLYFAIIYVWDRKKGHVIVNQIHEFLKDLTGR